MKKIVYIFALVFVSPLSLFAAEDSAVDECTETYNKTLTGDWGGARASLCNQGMNVDLVHKSDVLSTVAGGIKQGTAWLGHTEVGVGLDLEKLWGWDKMTAFVLYHSQLGSKFNANYVGSFMGVDNIETGVNGTQFYQAWVQKNFAEDRFSLLGGLYAIDSEFYVTETSGLFLQPPYGMANDLAQSNGPPIFPIGALALRLKYVADDFSVQYALMDGVPGDPNNPYGTHIRLDKGDGSLSIVEFGYAPKLSGEGAEGREYFNKTAVGYWRYSSRFADLDPAVVDALGNPIRHASQGAYFLAERTLFVEDDQPSNGLSGFVRFGTATSSIHQADKTGSVGLHYHGLLDGRDDDMAGIAVTVNHASDKYRMLNNSSSIETNVEAIYRAQINPWFALQPTVQYINHPNMDPVLKNIWVLGVRAEIGL